MVGSAGADSCDGISGIDSADSACETRANLDADVLFLTLYAPDGTRLDGELYIPTNDAATAGTREVAWVFRHGAQGTYATGVNQSAGLWGIAHGFTVLSLNGRDWGTAAGGGNTLFEDTTRDMAVGIDFLERIGFDKVFVAGHSGGTQAAGVYPALSNNDPRMVAVGLFGVVRDGREAATDVLFLPRTLYDSHIALSQQLVAEGRGEEILDYLTTFDIYLQRSPRTFLSYWGPDSLSVVVREIAAARVPVFLLRAEGDNFTPDAYSVDVRDAALAAGVDATYVEIPYPGPLGFTGGNAHSLLGVERRFLQETTDWLLAKVPAAGNFVSSRPARADGNYLPLPEAGTDSELVTLGGERMTLDGKNSVDLDGNLVRYAWTQTGGQAVNLQGADSPQASFEVPGSTSTLRFALSVTDDQGATATDTVTVQVNSLQPSGGSGSGDLLTLGALLAFASARRRSLSTFRRPRITL
jgi:pimeloyl-ACP methyl ester carboxylesterase